VDGFEKLIVETCKKKIRGWNSMRQSFKNSKIMLKSKLAEVELVIDKGNASEEVIYKRLEIVNSINELEKQQAMETAQKAKIKWAIEADVTIEEIKNAVWDCGTDKSPGPDGFSFDLYRRFWSVIQKDAVAALKCFFHYGSIPKGCNSSFIPLIPKILDAKMVKDFRPISLIGSLYKIIAKILANRLVTVLGDVINEIQSAADRQILDGLFILNEVLQWCKLKKKQSFIFKIDFEKAYDSVWWDYFEAVLKKFGFGEKWCKWIQCCGCGLLDDIRLPEVSSQTRWIKAVPIKLNILAWNVRLNGLPSRVNTSRRGIDINSILCPICEREVESVSHVFFSCYVAKDNFKKVCRWWNVDFAEVSSYDEWLL
nr:cysteine-rich receptor-like protein kinase [Tanacetum cinerariifolium]